MERPNIVYYGKHGLARSNVQPTRPLNVVFLTSIRDTGECDRNGIKVETGTGEEYMEGAIERVIRETRPGGVLRDLVNVVGVITDDREKDMIDSSYPVLPVNPGQNWIFPYNLLTSSGRLLREVTFNIPSDFRSVPSESIYEKRRKKFEFELAVLQKTQELGGDIIISDHYMARIDYLYAELGLFGKVLNIHPAVTDSRHPFCFRGKTPTMDAITWAQRGLPIRTGGTLHLIAEEIDAGPILAYTDQTPVYHDDKPQWLRYRNYSQAKLPVLVGGLAHYAQNIYPNLTEIEFRNLRQIVSPNGGNYEGVLLS